MKYRNKCVLIAQKIIRGYLARKKHQPRMRGILKLNAIKTNLALTKDIATQLKGGKDSTLKQVQEIEQLIENACNRIKSDSKIQATTIDSLYADIMARINNQNNLLNKQLQVNFINLIFN